MRNRLTSIGIMCLIIIGGFTGFITLESDVASGGTIIYVGSGAGNDSATINGGISLAKNGDTVYVYGGTYIENVIVDKTINLIGENRDKPIIDGGGSGDVVRITSNGVNITGFNITSGDLGINLLSSSNNYITCNNVYLNNRVGIFIDSSYNNITNNNISFNNGSGIYLFWSSNNNITGNNLSNNYYGIYNNGSSTYNIITNNKIFSNIWFGILLVFSSNYNLIMSNKISNNGNGIYLFESSNNLIYYNSLIDNTKQANDNTNDSNQWDNGYPTGGNYWSDYGGIDLNSTPAQDVPPPDDIGDTPYVIDSDSQDNYPLMVPMGESVSPLQPPVLYINVSQDGRDILLYWDPPPVQYFDPYLIYRSTDPTNFDFINPWVNTLTDKEPGELKPIPDRTMWNDTNAAFPGNKTNYKEQYYYVIRAFNDRGEVSRTSRTVGKWTKTFPQGVLTFSPPLEPLQNITIDYCLNDMNAEYIKWMNQTTHTWMKHGDGVVNDTQMKLGEGYELKFDTQTNYTFTGLPGAMISYDDDSGFSGFDHATEAKNLTVTVEPNGDVNLTWQEPSNMSNGWYEVYFSNTRDGFFGTFNTSYFSVCPPVNFGNNSATHVNALANKSGTRLYYMVVPYNASYVRGASTYSIGIWTEEYQSQYDTLGIPLKLSSNQTADWYHDNIPDTVGINYYIYSEQRWCWHSTRMPAGAYDPLLEMTEGYQISTSNPTKFTFIGE